MQINCYCAIIVFFTFAPVFDRVLDQYLVLGDGDGSDCMKSRVDTDSCDDGELVMFMWRLHPHPFFDLTTSIYVWVLLLGPSSYSVFMSYAHLVTLYS